MEKKKKILIISIICIIALLLLIFVISIINNKKEINSDTNPNIQVEISEEFSDLKFTVTEKNFSDTKTLFKVKISNNGSKEYDVNGYTIEFRDKDDKIIGTMDSGVEVTLKPGEEIETTVSRDKDYSNAQKCYITKKK